MTTRYRFTPGLVAIAAVLVASAARADTASTPIVLEAARTPLNLSVAHTPAGVSYAQAAALQAAGLAQTSVDHTFARGDAVGSFGFLCGRQAVYNHSGAADIRGYDPQGKFLGAKLSLAFK